MRARPRLTTAAAIVAAAALVLTGPVQAQSLDEARAERAAVQARLDDAAAALADLEAREGTLADEAAALERRMARLEDEAATAEERVGARVRELYKRGIDTPVLQLLGAEDADGALERAELAGHLLAGDRVELESAVAARGRVETVAEELAGRRDALAGVRDERAAALATLRDDLDRAAALEERLEAEERARREAERRAAEEAARRAAAAEARERAAASSSDATAPRSSAPTTSAPASGGTACPVGQPHSFTDTWGAPRSGGRSHEGVDILAPYGTPVYAIVAGTWDVRSYGSSAGNWAILRGVDGTTYYYMHLQSHTVGDGASVAAGTQTGTVGDTGNATGTPHLHFEVHPGGGGAVNPTPTANAAC